MRQDEALQVMTLGLRVGEVMLESSVATSDVQDAVRRVIEALGLEGCEVSVTLDVITLNHLDPSLDAPLTLVRVVRIGEPRLDRLVALEALVRKIHDGRLDVATAAREIEHFDRVDTRHPRWATLTGLLISAAAWVMFAGGGAVGAIAALLAALVNEVVLAPLNRTRIPTVFVTFLSAVVVATVPNLFAFLELPVAVLPAVVGGLYPLLPGGLLVASVTDGLSGAPLSSLAKGLEATVVASAVALGVVATLSVADHLGIESGTERPVISTVFTVLMAALAVSGLAVARSMPMRLVPATAAIAMAAWLVNRLLWEAGYNQILALFTAAVVVGLGGQLAALLHRTAAVVHTTSSVYVLVPGFTFYVAMVALARSDADAGLPVMVDAIGRAGAIAAGVALGVALGRSVPAPRPRVALWRRGNRRGVPRAQAGVPRRRSS